MNELRFDYDQNKGIMVRDDDFKALANTLYQIETLFSGHYDFVISGCTSTGTANNATISPGIVYVAGRIRTFDGASGVDMTIPTYITASVTTNSSTRPLQPDGTFERFNVLKAELTNIDPNPFLSILLTFGATPPNFFFDKFDARFYTKSMLDGGQLDSRYYTETEINNKFGTSFTALTLLGSFTGSLDVRKQENGTTQLSGAVLSPVGTTSGSIIAVLPVGFRPSNTYTILKDIYMDGGSPQWEYIEISASGNIVIRIQTLTHAFAGTPIISPMGSPGLGIARTVNFSDVFYAGN